MPRYVVTDSKNNWLETGIFDTPDDAVNSAIYNCTELPGNMYVFKVAEIFHYSNLSPNNKKKYIQTYHQKYSLNE